MGSCTKGIIEERCMFWGRSLLKVVFWKLSNYSGNIYLTHISLDSKSQQHSRWSQTFNFICIQIVNLFSIDFRSGFNHIFCVTNSNSICGHPYDLGYCSYVLWCIGLLGMSIYMLNWVCNSEVGTWIHASQGLLWNWRFFCCKKQDRNELCWDSCISKSQMWWNHKFTHTEIQFFWNHLSMFCLVLMTWCKIKENILKGFKVYLFTLALG